MLITIITMLMMLLLLTRIAANHVSSQIKKKTSTKKSTLSQCNVNWMSDEEKKAKISNGGSC